MDTRGTYKLTAHTPLSQLELSGNVQVSPRFKYHMPFTAYRMFSAADPTQCFYICKAYSSGCKMLKGLTYLPEG